MDQRGQIILDWIQGSLLDVRRPDAPSLCPCSYFAVVVYKVLVLLVEELGGSNAFLTHFSGKPFRINTGPCCCCCMCLPRVPMSRYFHHGILHTLFVTVPLLRLFPPVTGGCYSGWRSERFSTRSWRRCSQSSLWFYGPTATLTKQT